MNGVGALGSGEATPHAVRLPTGMNNTSTNTLDAAVGPELDLHLWAAYGLNLNGKVDFCPKSQEFFS